jgi:sterol desaturase/sphingolipid hydroxylase (fatty acid hydroxylase superfamily)
MSFIIAVFLGIGFGFSLNKAGLTKYHRIANQFRFKDMMVMKYIMTALSVALIGLYGLHAFGLVTFPTAPSTYVVGNLVGGLIFGIGMSLVGY